MAHMTHWVWFQVLLDRPGNSVLEIDLFRPVSLEQIDTVRFRNLSESTLASVGDHID